MKVLIVAPAWVGDMVMAHTLVQVLHADADPTIAMLAPPATAPLAERMPGVADVVVLDVSHGELGLGKRRAMGLKLRSGAFDVAYVLPNSFKSALVPFWARIPQRIGWQGEARLGVLNLRRRLDRERYPLMIERFMALGREPEAAMLSPYPQPRLTADPANRDTVVERLSLNLDMPVTVLCPGAEYGEAKRWPERHFATVANYVASTGHPVWLVGSPNDQPVCANIAALAPAAINLAGRTSLLDAVDLLSLATQVVCNDSGLMHVACALDRPVVVVYGSTSPAFTPPLSGAATVLHEDLDCRPCFQRECPLGHLNCLNQLDPSRVIEALN